MLSTYNFYVNLPKGLGGSATLYTEILYDYMNDGQTGFIEFNGYFYYSIGDESNDRYEKVKNAVLCVCNIHDRENILPPRPDSERLCDTFWEIEFTHREILKNTDSISQIEDQDGSVMDVCFFPTNYQRIHFKILREIKKGEKIPEEYA